MFYCFISCVGLSGLVIFTMNTDLSPAEQMGITLLGFPFFFWGIWRGFNEVTAADSSKDVGDESWDIRHMFRGLVVTTILVALCLYAANARPGTWFSFWCAFIGALIGLGWLFYLWFWLWWSWQYLLHVFTGKEIPKPPPPPPPTPPTPFHLTKEGKKQEKLRSIRQHYSQRYAQKRSSIGKIKCPQCHWTGNWGDGVSYETWFVEDLLDRKVIDRTAYFNHVSLLRQKVTKEGEYKCPRCNSTNWHKV